MRRTILTFGFLMALFALALTAPSTRKVKAAVDNGNGNGEGHTPVTLCHRTSSAKNPFVIITVDDDAEVLGHITNHGDVKFQEGGEGGGCPEE